MVGHSRNPTRLKRQCPMARRATLASISAISYQRIRDNSGRVDLGGCPPRSPTDPGLHITRTRFLIS